MQLAQASIIRRNRTMKWLGLIVRFIVSAIVLLFVGLIVPQFSVGGFWSAVLMALFIAIAGQVIEAVIRKRVTPFRRGIIGFVLSAQVIYGSQFFIDNVEVSLLGSIIGALAIGIIDLFTPLATPYGQGNPSS